MAKSGKIERFEDLIAWQKSKHLSVLIYRTSSKAPFSKDFGLRDQIRKAVISIMSNIAEGFERYSPREFRQFLSIARGSAAEVRSQLHLARELDYIPEDEAVRMIALSEEIRRILGGLRKSLNTEKAK
jgi:four helix bundle protein